MYAQIAVALAEALTQAVSNVTGKGGGKIVKRKPLKTLNKRAVTSAFERKRLNKGGN